MPRLTTAKATHAIHSVEQLIESYETWAMTNFNHHFDQPFRDYLTNEVAPTMSADERARYEGYLRFYYEEKLDRSPEQAPRLERPDRVQTVSPTTAMAYERYAENLINAFERTTGAAFSPDSEAFAAYMGERLSRVGRSTRRTYRAAMDYHYRVILGRPEGAPDFREWIPDRAETEAPEPARPRRQKGLSPAHAEALIARLRRSNHFHAQLAANTLEAGIIVGLRPSEWVEARLINVQPDSDGPLCQALQVRNAKQSHQRAHSPTRTLIFDENRVSWRQIRVIHDAARDWQAYVERFAADNAEQANLADRRQAIQNILKSTSAVIKSATRSLRLPAYTLYSARHQFAANAKAAGCTPVEVAAMMGHADTETAGEHYGKRRRGSKGGLLVRPSAHDIAAVEARVTESLKARLERIQPRDDAADDLSL